MRNIGPGIAAAVSGFFADFRMKDPMPQSIQPQVFFHEKVGRLVGVVKTDIHCRIRGLIIMTAQPVDIIVILPADLLPILYDRIFNGTNGTALGIVSDLKRFQGILC